MKHGQPLIGLLMALLVGWLSTLFVLGGWLHDIWLFVPGRERWFGAVVNAAFLFAIILLAWRMRQRRVILTICLALFLTVLFATGLWTPFVAVFGGPPWNHKIVKIPFSADTPYVDDNWAWENPNQNDLSDLADLRNRVPDQQCAAR